LSDPAATSELCGFWAAEMRGGDDAPRPLVDLVAGPTTGGVILAFETARQLGLRSIFAEEVRAADGGTRREFRRGFAIMPGERVLLVDDILTTGGSLLAMIPAVEAMGGVIVQCAVLVDRSGGRATLTSPTTGRTYPLRSLWQLDLPTYEPGEASCPRCAAGEPVHAPGSTGGVTPAEPGTGTAPGA
jgi:orotate phosphoribosyltransferase